MPFSESTVWDTSACHLNFAVLFIEVDYAPGFCHRKLFELRKNRKPRAVGKAMERNQMIPMINSESSTKPVIRALTNRSKCMRASPGQK
jgi:hypothetical protein